MLILYYFIGRFFSLYRKFNNSYKIYNFDVFVFNGIYFCVINNEQNY